MTGSKVTVQDVAVAGAAADGSLDPPPDRDAALVWSVFVEIVHHLLEGPSLALTHLGLGS